MLRFGVSLRVGGHTDRRAKAPCAPSGSREAPGVYGSGLARPVSSSIFYTSGASSQVFLPSFGFGLWPFCAIRSPTMV